jgi:hypothetical protein
MRTFILRDDTLAGEIEGGRDGDGTYIIEI